MSAPKKKAARKAARKASRKASPRVGKLLKPRGARANGRPRIEFDLVQVAAMSQLRLPYEDMAVRFGCSIDTIRERLREGGPYFDREFSEAYAQGLTERNIGIRQKQYEVAMAGSAAMLIHLGKHEHGQREPMKVGADKPERGRGAVDLRKLSTKQLRAWRELALIAESDEERAGP